MKSTRRAVGLRIFHGVGVRFRAALTALALGTAWLVPALVPLLVPAGSTAHAQFRADAHELPRLGDAAGSDLSPETERRIGESIMQDLRRQRAIVADAELVDWLNGFARRLVDTQAARGFEFEFFLLDDNSLNAFALPGGYIGVHTGLVTASQTESELASVLAHEIGHVTQRHIARMLAKNRESSVLSLAAVVLGMLAASSNPQAAAGIIALGGSVQSSQMLSFSRDAEREADRIGLEILRESDFQATDMIAFFSRLQNATRVYESGAPAYLRTHPLTGERMADIQNRVFELRYRQRTDSVDFHLVRARMSALVDTSVDGLTARRRILEEQIARRSFQNEAAAWYALSLVAAAQRDFDTARAALATASGFIDGGGPVSGQALPGHPFLVRAAIDLEAEAGNRELAIEWVDRAIERHSGARAIRHLKAGLLLAAGRYDEAIAFLEEERTVYRTDTTVFETLARAYAADGQSGMSHWVNGERYVLLGALNAAREQMRIAQRDTTLDFYRLSQIDVRLRQIEDDIRREDERS